MVLSGHGKWKVHGLLHMKRLESSHLVDMGVDVKTVLKCF